MTNNFEQAPEKAQKPSIPRDQLCLWLDLTARQIRALEDSGKIPKAMRGRYEISATVRGIVTHFRDREQKRAVLDIYDSMGHCSSATGIPIAVIRHAKRSGCAEAFESKQVKLAPLIRWLFSQEAEESGVDWGAEFKKWQAKREKIKHDRDDRAVISRDEVEEGIRKHISFMFAELERTFCNEFPASVRGMDSPAIAAKSREAIEKLKSTLREHFGRLATSETPG